MSGIFRFVSQIGWPPIFGRTYFIEFIEIFAYFRVSNLAAASKFGISLG